jgi:hypothetical protein
MNALRWARCPQKSRPRQKAVGAALAAKRGESKKSDLQGPARNMYESMNEDQLEDFASTERKHKPEHNRESQGAMSIAVHIHESGHSSVFRSKLALEPGPGELRIQVHAANVNPVDNTIPKGISDGQRRWPYPS